MRKVAILIAASPTAAFYSQVAAMCRCLRQLNWSRWRPSVHVYVGGLHDRRVYDEWLPRLGGVKFIWASDERFARDGDWAQSDDVFRFAPHDADILLAMDADTLPVADLEDLLDRVDGAGAIAGVIAHYPFPLHGATSLRQTWTDLARGLVNVPLEFTYAHTLLPGDAPEEQRLTPFYLNFGVVLFPRAVFEDVSAHYLRIRPRLMERMADPDFSGQVALTLALTAAGVKTLALPMRFNFPNDPVADAMYPEELANVAIFHYLRTNHIDRHRLFVDAEQYRSFLRRALTGSDRSFQASVRAMLGPEYPFSTRETPVARHT